MTAPRRRPSYSLGWGTLLRHPTHSYWLVILSTTPCDTPHDVSRYVAPSSAAPRPFNTRVTKIGLIDPDDPTKEGNGSHVDKSTTAGIKASSTNGLLWLLLLQVVGGHGAIKKDAVWLMDGMVDVGMLGKRGKLLLTNDGSKKASFL